ncbi:cell division protein FtsQ/DivIB [Motilibacter deserti]|uniref:FtsQ-type POTRA domain-containing protein n=1 Tax=Motilibacter deserti TaxID=2714956 RepID=A0ABX0GPB6_9ACTN|nr:FtsQ-type POTRA domain-containing protein [Motilibacter deserti]NHC12295.1 FtsQ-type POTRA domain-containing protein [Motilibacter deserti]
MGVLAGLVVLLGVAAWVALGTSLLGVRTVEVVGASRVPPEQVRAAADVSPGFPLARVDPAAVRERVAAIPAVRDVRVERRFPRTLVVTVAERTPVAVTSMRDSGLTYVDAAGVAFAPAPPAAAKGKTALPVLRTAAGPTRVAAAVVVGGLPAGLQKRVVRVEAKTPDSVTLVLRSGHSVVWGDVERAQRKAEVLVALMAAVKDAKTYDVSAPDAPTTRST